MSVGRYIGGELSIEEALFGAPKSEDSSKELAITLREGILFFN